ncbi:MAG: LCP family protein [Anaerolineaceae bacterium]
MQNHQPVGGKTNVDNEYARMRQTSWRSQPASRSDSSWNVDPMARPARRRQRASMDSLTRVLIIALVGVILAAAGVLVAILSNAAQTVQPAAGAAAPAASDENVALPAEKDGQTVILILGSDQRPEDGSFRTDVILLMAVNTDNKSVSVVSFPRDLWVSVPNQYEMKINQVFETGGFEAMSGMFQSNFGVTPDYYVMTNFNGFVQFVDSQGGVDVEVGQELTDDCDLPQAVNGDCTVVPGTVHMDGATALWYVRSRYTTSDIDRLRREQEVLYAIAQKMLNLKSVKKLSAAQTALQENVQTNMSVEDALSFFPLATRVLKSPDDSIHRFSITENQATPSWSWDGMWILLPNQDMIREILRQAGFILPPAQ